MFLSMVPDSQTVLGVRNTRLICTWRVMLLRENCSASYHPWQWHFKYPLLEALKRLFAAPAGSAGSWHWLFAPMEMVSSSGLPWWKQCMVQRWEHAQEATESLSVQPARTESCQQPLLQSVLPFKWVPEILSGTSTSLSSTGKCRHWGGTYGGHLAGCCFSTGKIGGKLQTPAAACSVSEGMVGQLGTSRDLSPKLWCWWQYPAASRSGCEGCGCLTASSALLTHHHKHQGEMLLVPFCPRNIQEQLSLKSAWWNRAFPVLCSYEWCEWDWECENEKLQEVVLTFKKQSNPRTREMSQREAFLFPLKSSQSLFCKNCCLQLQFIRKNTAVLLKLTM